MIFDQSQNDLNAWKTEMHLYEKGKRTKKPFGKSISSVAHVTNQQIKAKQCLFNPILQNYQRPEDEFKAMRLTEQNRARSLVSHLKQTIKYQKNFDIINLKSNEPYTQKTMNRKQAPIRNAYNVINNQKIPDFFFQNRQIRLPIEREKKLLPSHEKDYNIVSNYYKKDHEIRQQQELQKQMNQIHKKYWTSHDFDPVFGTYYDKQKEEQYQQELRQKQIQFGKDTDKKLPPSYIYREPFIADFTKPLPEALKVLDERNANAKKRFQTKYVVLDQYEKRNQEEEARQEQIIKNHVHFGRILDQKSKQFNIVTNKSYQPTRAEQLYGKKSQIESWQQLLKQVSRAPVSTKSLIKTAGFS